MHCFCCCFSFPSFFVFSLLFFLNQSKRIGHRCRPSCLISILYFQTMIIHAVSLSPHSEEVEIKIDIINMTLLYFEGFFFMIMCNPQLNQYKDNIQTYIYINIYLNAVKKREKDKFSMCTSRIFFLHCIHTPTQVNICPFLFLFFFIIIIPDR